jgi:hypothetical protein
MSHWHNSRALVFDPIDRYRSRNHTLIQDNLQTLHCVGTGLADKFASPAHPTTHQAPASSLPRLRNLHLHRHPQRRQHRQHLADLRSRFAGFQIDDETQPDIGDARELVLPQLLRLAGGSRSSLPPCGEGGRVSGRMGVVREVLSWQNEARASSCN